MKTKNITSIIIAFFMLTVLNSNTLAQKAKKYEECKIKVSATCNSCKEKIMKNIAFEKGVRDIHVDLDTKIATIKYKIGKTNSEKLIKAIEKLGYSAKLINSNDKFTVDIDECEGDDHNHESKCSCH